MADRILIAGIGIIFFGDDAFGVEVVRQLTERGVPDGVRVVDFGIRGLDLAYALMETYECVILVDAMARGEPPGTLYVIEPEDDPATEADALQLMMDAHVLTPDKALRLATALGKTARRCILIGCEPAALGDLDAMQELSEPVRAAVAEALRVIDRLVAEVVASK